MSNPVCNVCGATGTGHTFNLFPKVPGLKFGDICTECEKVILRGFAANRD